MKKVSLLMPVLAIAVSVTHCAKPFEPTKPPVFVKTPASDQDAELMALHFSGEIMAPMTMYERYHSELEAIHQEYDELIPQLASIRFWPPFGISSRVGFTIDSATFGAIEDGTYTRWNRLNDKYEMIDYRLWDWSHTGIYYLQVTFQGRRHPDVIGRDYETTLGFVYNRAEGHLGDYPKMFPRMVDGNTTYLYRHAEGDCPAGCGISEFWYFRVKGGKVEYVGHWLPDRYRENVPEWWDEAKENWNDFQPYPFLGD